MEKQEVFPANKAHIKLSSPELFPNSFPLFNSPRVRVNTSLSGTAVDHASAASRMVLHSQLHPHPLGAAFPTLLVQGNISGRIPASPCRVLPAGNSFQFSRAVNCNPFIWSL